MGVDDEMTKKIMTVAQSLRKSSTGAETLPLIHSRQGRGVVIVGG